MKNISKSKKYQAILITGKDLFWRYGLKRVSIEEICKEASVSKMTFYKYFPNKVDLAKQILSDIMQEALQQFKGVLESDNSFEQKVEQMMRMKMEGTKELSAEFMNDIYKQPENGLLEFMQKHGHQLQKLFVDFLQQAKRTGDIRNDIKIDFIIYQMNKMTDTVNDAGLLSKYSSPNELIMENMRFFFYGLTCSKTVE
ncbi:TetR/AcrR family transcriptional regulator [Carboxylicivirga sp. M1479]|uniref:TetR/AcrR family transcriptional regulator n=2 Tax=Carboxylicivirga TaxID=1628153 RepID=UPI00163D9057|nr:TetR/AcrR family transcriptional regulator [Carboxylicivirga sp. M1479]